MNNEQTNNTQDPDMDANEQEAALTVEDVIAKLEREITELKDSRLRAVADLQNTARRGVENEARARKAEASRRATDAPGEFRVSRASPPCAACKCSPRRHNPSPHR